MCFTLGVIGSHGRYLKRTTIGQVCESEGLLGVPAWSPESREEKNKQTPTFLSNISSSRELALTSNSLFSVPPFSHDTLPTILIIAWRASASLCHPPHPELLQAGRGAEPSLGIQHHPAWVGHRKVAEEVCVQWGNE